MGISVLDLLDRNVVSNVYLSAFIYSMWMVRRCGGWKLYGSGSVSNQDSSERICGPSLSSSNWKPHLGQDRMQLSLKPFCNSSLLLTGKQVIIVHSDAKSSY